MASECCRATLGLSRGSSSQNGNGVEVPEEPEGTRHGDPSDYLQQWADAPLPKQLKLDTHWTFRQAMQYNSALGYGPPGTVRCSKAYTGEMQM